MSFDWLHYIDIAQELFEQATSSPHQDANLRSSISRAYYGTFHKARHHLYDKWAISVSKDVNAHFEVRKEFNKKHYYRIATTLNRMRLDRNIADYDDTTIDLAITAKENLKRAKQVIAELHNM